MKRIIAILGSLLVIAVGIVQYHRAVVSAAREEARQYIQKIITEQEKLQKKGKK